MRPSPLGGLTIKAVLTLGFGLTLALWLVTGYQFAENMSSAEQQVTAVAARHVQAQDLLTTFRAHVLASSGTARDALLDRTQQPIAVSRAELQRHLRDVRSDIAAYVPVLDSVEEKKNLELLRSETARFADGLNKALTGDTQEIAGGAERFRSDVLPLRTSLLRAADDFQSINRSAFVRYRTDLAAIHGAAERSMHRQLGLALLCSLGIAVIATLYAGRLEKRLITQLMDNALKTRALQDLSIKVIRAQEDERRRIAHELHDEVGQALTAIKVELAVAERAVGRAGGAPEMLRAVQTITDGALHTVRDLSHLLHPAVLDDLGLPDAVDSYLRDFSKRFGIRTELEVDGLSARLPADVEVAAYRMIQEATTNVAKHAHATRCRVSVKCHADRLEIEVGDDGDGFDPAAANVATGQRGLGIIGMRERALQLAGVVTIDSRPGKGTMVRISLSAGLPSPSARRELLGPAALAGSS